MLETILGSESFKIIRIVLDISLLSLIYYFLYRLLRTVKVPLLLNQIGLVLLAYIVAALLGLETVLWIFKNVIGWVIIAAIVIFHPELRALVMRTDYARLFQREKKQSVIPDMHKLTLAIQYLIRQKRGALFVFPRSIDLEQIVTTKVEINADLSVELLETIFSHDTALHDGAVIIHGNSITHAGCFLPIIQGDNTQYNLGSRHRAAIGLSQNSDAIILALSEESGSVSLVFDGEILYDIEISKCCAYIENLLSKGHIDIAELEINYLSIDSAESLGTSSGEKRL